MQLKYFLKVACTTITTIFWKLSYPKKVNKISHSKNYHFFLHTQFAKKLSMFKLGMKKTTDIQAYKDKKKMYLFTFVRHPFER